MGEMKNSDRSAETLWKRMRATAATGHPMAAELNKRANELETIASDPDSSIPRLVGAWARARAVWCKATGEPLI